MTRPTPGSRTTSSTAASSPSVSGRSYPSLRSRNPLAYWLAIISVAAMVLSTIGVAVGAIL